MIQLLILITIALANIVTATSSWAATPQAALDAEQSGDQFFSEKKYDQAIEMYSKALKIDPEFMRIPPKLGILYVLTKDYPKAEQMFETAVRSNPKDALITSNYASVLLLNDKLEEAVGAAKLSLQIKPDPKTYMTLGQAYARLKKNDMASIAFEKGILLGGDDPEVLARLQESTGQREK